MSGPDRRAGPGQSLPFTCTSGGFFPKDISVKWLKDKALVTSQPPQITPGQMKFSFNMSSTVTVTLQEGDIHSQLICRVQHPTLEDPLDGTYLLSKALRGEGWGHRPPGCPVLGGVGHPMGSRVGGPC